MYGSVKEKLEWFGKVAIAVSLLLRNWMLVCRREEEASSEDMQSNNKHVKALSAPSPGNPVGKTLFRHNVLSFLPRSEFFDAFI